MNIPSIPRLGNINSGCWCSIFPSLKHTCTSRRSSISFNSLFQTRGINNKKEDKMHTSCCVMDQFEGYIRFALMWGSALWNFWKGECFEFLEERWTLQEVWELLLELCKQVHFARRQCDRLHGSNEVHIWMKRGPCCILLEVVDEVVDVEWGLRLLLRKRVGLSVT